MPADAKTTSPKRALNIVGATKRLGRLAGKGQAAARAVFESKLDAKPQPADPLNLAGPFGKLARKLARRPDHLLKSELELWWQHMKLAATQVKKAAGVDADPIIAPERSDRRFKSDKWDDSLLFDTLKQSYLLTSTWLRHTLTSVPGLDERSKTLIDFHTRQFVNAVAPTNFALTNPDVLAATVETGGENLLRGLENLLDDIERGGGKLKVRMTDENAFEIGKDVATTPGKVVFQTDLAQLIQIEPKTDTVHKRPVLIVPPWINKYYILDLRPKNSLVKWLTEQGHTVFILSWVNPGKNLAHKGFEDYLLEGPVAAIDAIQKATGTDQVNAIGYCLGGTLLATTLGYLTAKGDDRIASATFMASLTDFEEAGEIRVFIDEKQVSAIEKRMEKQGYLDEAAMAFSFNALRENDLVWSYVVHNYLMGKDPVPFDMLFWNADSTRMPAKMHSFYLRNMYLENNLAKPNGIKLNGVSIDLSKVKTPVFYVSLVDDHIAPWKATYRATQLYGGPVKFVLGGSGHIAGVINHPSRNKYGYWTNDDLPEQADAWFDTADKNEGSWWREWAEWVSPQNGESVRARTPGDGELTVIEDAPGSYVVNRPE